MSAINGDYKGRTDMAEQYRAYQAEKDKVRDENEAELDNVKKAYAAQKADLQDRFEQSIQDEKLAQYDHLRNLKGQMNRETRDLESKAKQVIHDKETSNNREESQIVNEGKAKIDKTRRDYMAMEDFEHAKVLEAENQIKNDHRKNAEFLIQDADKKLKTLTDQKEQFLETSKQNHAQALNEIQGHYVNAKTALQDQYQTELKGTAHALSQDLNQRKLASANAIVAFDHKHDDSFYQIKQFDSELTDNGPNYILKVKVPEYERGQFRVQTAGQFLQLIGNRTMDEKASEGPGHEMSTRSYQSVSERIRLDHPVDGKAITWVADGDWMEYTIPKFGPSHRGDEIGKARDIAVADAEIGRELSFIDTLPKPSATESGQGKGNLS